MTPWFHSIHIFAFLHSLYVHGRKWSVLFLVIGFSLGLASEHVGATYGWVFGKFHYQPDRIMLLGTVPIFTPLSWWLILYPSLALFLVMLLGVFVGEGVRNAYDPKQYSRLE